MTGRYIFCAGAGLDIGDLAARRREVFIPLVPLNFRQCIQKGAETMDRVIQGLGKGTVTLNTVNN